MSVRQKLDDNFRQIICTLADNAARIVCMLINAAFLCLWAGLQWWMDSFLQEVEMDFSPISSMALLVFQALFALSTSAYIVYKLYEDIRVMHIRSRRVIQAEEHKPETMPK